MTQHCIYLQGRTELLILSLKVKVKSHHFFFANIKPFIFIYLSLLLKDFMVMYVSRGFGVNHNEPVHLEVCIICLLDRRWSAIDDELLK